MKLVSVTQVYLVTKKIEPSLVAVLLLNTFQKSPSSLPSHLLFTPSSSSWGNGPEKTSPQIHVTFVSGVHLIERLLAPYLFLGLSFRLHRFLRLEIIDPFHHVH
ncbi:hypothetical protein AVEN_237263-1 [Araneus ventricosus]|uniref:Uncharacterized protein n=1 Tax=Araneus ventricosus TaxID=182803 RepID=A0A4Y2S8Z0_ARAVE|nr:hypothetical protein AVEN_237263-1 [Araneus ventricosus]